VKLTKPRLIRGSWAFADEPRFYIYPDEYTPKMYGLRAAVYFANLLNDMDAVLIKIEDNISNLAEMETLPPQKRERNIGAMVEHLLWAVPRLFGVDEYRKLLFDLQRWGFDIPKEMLPKVPSSPVVVLPSRAQLGPELLRLLPPPGPDYISLYGLPDAGFYPVIELGLPSSIVGLASERLVSMVHHIYGSSSDVNPVPSLVHPSLAVHETILRVAVGRPANFDQIVKLTGDVYEACVVPGL
jgi:hypothetical protein